MELSDSSGALIENPVEGSYFKTRLNAWSEWELKHDSLRKPEFIVYAVVWTKVIWQNAMMGRPDEEDEDGPSVPRQLYDVHCTQSIGSEGTVLDFEWEEHIQNELVQEIASFSVEQA